MSVEAGEELLVDEAGREKRKKKRNIFLPSLIIIFLGVAFVTLFNSTVFDVTDYEVLGTKYMSNDEVIMLSGIKEGQNIFTAPLRTFKKNLLGIPRFSNVSVTRKLPHTIVIDITERETIAYLPYAGYFIEMDEEGTAIRITQKITSADTPIVTGTNVTYAVVGDSIEPKEKMMTAAKISSSLIKGGLRSVSEVNVSGDDMYAMTSDGIKILIGNTKDLDAKVEVIVSVIASEREHGKSLKTLDVRVYTKPVIKR